MKGVLRTRLKSQRVFWRRLLEENDLGKGNKSYPGEKKTARALQQRGLQNKHGLPNIPIMFIRLTPKNARWNGKRLDEIFHTRILEVGIEFSMNTCYHLDT